MDKSAAKRHRRPRRHPAGERGGGQRLGKERSTAVDELDGEAGELVLGAGAPFAQHEIRRLQDRADVAGPATADIAGLHALLLGERPHDRAMLAMRANGEDDGFGAQVHGAAI